MSIFLLYFILLYNANKAIEQKAKELNVKIEAMEIMPDYVHMFVLASPAITHN